MDKVEKVARVICEHYGYNPEDLEPGTNPTVDGICPNGDPGFFYWREYVDLAEKVIAAMSS